jgi:ABC-type sugar transport system substrate-binding protein
MAELGVGLGGYEAVLDEAKSKNIPILTYVFGATPGTIAVAPDQILDGQLMAKEVVSAVPKGGTVLSLRNDTNPGLKQRADGFKQEISGKPAFKLVEKQVPELTSESANKLVTQFLQSNPGTVAIQGGFGDWALGASAAVRQASSKAIVVSTNGDPTEYQEMAKPNSPLVMTAADSHEASAQLACETIAVVLGGGQPFGPSAVFSSIAITKDNLPADLKVDTTPRTVTAGG